MSWMLSSLYSLVILNLCHFISLSSNVLFFLRLPWTLSELYKALWKEHENLQHSR